MTNIEAVSNVLKEVNCQTSNQIAVLAKVWYDYDITAAQVAGALRSLSRSDKICSSNCGNGKTVYWLKEREV